MSLWAVVVATTLLCAPAPALAATPPVEAPVHTVVVVLAPFLSWSDVAPGKMPQLLTLASGGALGNMNALTADPGWPTVAGGALTLSAGKWVAAPTGVSLTASSMPAAQAANARSLDPPVLGALGSALQKRGLKTAAIGNSSEDTSAPSGVRLPASLVAADASGTVNLNLGGPGMLTSDPTAPFGVRADPRAIQTALGIAAADGSSLIVVDPGDLERAHDATLSPQAAQRAHLEAVIALDKTLGDVQGALVGQRAMIIVLAPATDKPYYEPPYFAPLVVVGQNLTGLLTSPSTRRDGLITNLDIAPTVLAALGVDTAPSMLGKPATTADSMSPILGRTAARQDPSALIAGLAATGTFVGAVDYVRDLYFILWFSTAASLLAFLIAALALFPAASVFRRVVRWLSLVALSVPAAAWLMFAFAREPQTTTAVAVAFVGTLAFVAIAVISCDVLPRLGVEVSLLTVSSLTTLLICADQWFGSPLVTGMFSYSIRGGWRYYGMGNEGAALLVGASALAVGLACDLAKSSRRAALVRTYLAPAVAVVVLATIAAPSAGANAGALVWGVIAFAVLWVRAVGHRFTWKTVGLVAVVVVAAVALFAFADSMRGSGQTHLGRFVSNVIHDPGQAWALIARKAQNNYNYIAQTPYTRLALSLTATLIAMMWWRGRPLARSLAGRPGVSAAFTAVVVGGIAALLTEDSGVVMPALMLFAGALPAMVLALADVDRGDTAQPAEQAEPAS